MGWCRLEITSQLKRHQPEVSHDASYKCYRRHLKTLRQVLNIMIWGINMTHLDFCALKTISTFLSVKMAARSEARIVFSSSNTGIVGSNTIRGMDVYPRFFCVMLSCVGRGLASGRSPVKGVLPNALVSFRKKKKVLNNNRPRWPTLKLMLKYYVYYMSIHLYRAYKYIRHPYPLTSA
jgi:hypothetical protein